MTVERQMNEVETARRWLTEWAIDWRGEVPTRIHDSTYGQSYGLGSAPPFAPEFIRYVGSIECKNEECRDPECRRTRRREVYMDGDGYRDPNQDHRSRMTRAFRKLRKAAPREYDVLWMAVMHGLTIEQITERLNERAIRGGHEDRYTAKSVAFLALCGIDKTSKWLG